MNRKRRLDDDGDEMISPGGSPVLSTRPVARPSKRFRQSELTGRPLSFPRFVETLDKEELRKLVCQICDDDPHVGQKIEASAPRRSPEASLRVLAEYQEKLEKAWPYGNSSQEYSYFRVKHQLEALVEAVTDFTPQYLPPYESQAAISLEYLHGATKVIHDLPDWEPHSYRHHKDNAYDDISKAWALVITEAGKRGGGFNLLNGGWQQALEKHHQQSGGRMGMAMNAIATSVGPFGNGGVSSHNDPNSIRNQLLSGTYGTTFGSPIRVGP